MRLKILQARLQQYWTVNFQMFKLILEKAEEPEITLPTSARSSKKQESYRKTSISALLTMPKPLIVWITINCAKFWNRWEYQTTWPASWEILATWCKELTYLKRPWCWYRLRAGEEGDDRGRDGWMASPTQWTWVWVDSGSWWWTGRPGVLWFMGS